MPSYQSDRESAQEKHRLRRAAIVSAASWVMRTDGVAACTVRRIAKEAGVSPSVIHYYFADTQEIVDKGYAAITDRYFARLAQLHGTFDDPTPDFWHALAAYTEPWAAHPRMALLWSEYYTISGNNHRTSGVEENYRRTIDLIAGFLAAIGDGRLEGRAPSVWRHLTGTIDSRHVVPISLQEILDDVALIVGLDAPVVSAILCPDDNCWCKGRRSPLFSAPAPQAAAPAQV